MIASVLQPTDFSPEQAIIKDPLMVSPLTNLVDVIQLMNQSHITCDLTDSGDASIQPTTMLEQARSSSVLVIENQKLIGIFTERDLVRLIAQNTLAHGQDLCVADVMTSPVKTVSLNEVKNIFAVVERMGEHQVRHLPVLDEEGQVVGIITPESTRNCLQAVDLLRLRQVRDAMSKDVIHAKSTVSMLALTERMADYQVSCVVIIDPDSQGRELPVGIMTERDIVQFHALNLDFRKIQVKDVMSAPVWNLHPDDTLWTAHQQMLQRRIRRLIVCGMGGDLMGIVTQTSILRTLNPNELYGVIQALQQEIGQLKSKQYELMVQKNDALNQQIQKELGIRQRTEIKLRQERDFNSAVLDTVGSLIVVLAPQGRIVRFNHACEVLTGYQFEEVRGRFLWDVLLETEMAADMAAEFEELNIEHFPQRREYYWRTQTGDRHFISWCNTLLMGTNDEIKYVIATGEDITERRKTEAALRESEQGLRQLTIDLEQRVAERTSELMTTNVQLESSIHQLEQRNREMVVTSRMMEFLQACNTPEEAEPALTEFLSQLFPQCAGGIFVQVPHSPEQRGATEGNTEQILHAQIVFGDLAPSELSFPFNACWALRRGQSHSASDRQPGLFCSHVHLDPMPMATLCIPLTAQGQMWGLMYIRMPASVTPTLEQEQLAHTVATQISLALSNLRLREQLQQDSIRDPLTGLFNRRYLQEILPASLTRATQNEKPLSLIMIDIDHFKQLNDTFGHDAGDVFLQELGQFLMAQVRESDIICRYGGEEIILILPNTPLEAASGRATRLCEEVRQLRVLHRNHVLTATLSLGVATFPIHAETADKLIQHVDLALYEAKNQGRDRVIAFDT